MNVGSFTSSLAQDVSQTSQQRTLQQAELLLLKKAMNIQEDAALALIEAVSATAPSSTGSDAIGTNINISV